VENTNVTRKYPHFTLSVLMFLKITDRNIMLKVTIYTGTYGNGVTKTGEARLCHKLHVCGMTNQQNSNV